MNITYPQMRHIFALLKEHGIEDHSELVQQFSEGSTTSLKALTMNQAQNLIQSLKKKGKFQLKPIDENIRTMGNRVIWQLIRLGYAHADGRPDYDRINAYIQGIGTNNPRQVSLWQLTPEEMHAVCTQVHARYITTVKP